MRSWLALAVCIVPLAAILLHPYQIGPRNGASWLDGEDGIYFSGEGIAYTETDLSAVAQGPLGEVTFQLWVHERPRSENWGATVLLAAFDAKELPPLSVGQYASRIFLYDPRGKPVSNWYDQFRLDESLRRGEDHLITVVLGHAQRAIYIDDRLAREDDLREEELHPLDLSGRLVLGNEPGGRRGWEGEIKGVAVFGRALVEDEVKSHFSDVSRDGMRALEGRSGLVTLVPLDEGRGTYAHSLTHPSGGFRIPERFCALPSVLWTRPTPDREQRRVQSWDAVYNIALFIPVGVILFLGNARRGRSWPWIGIATLTGGVLSVAFEVLQLFIPSRTSSSIDILSNSLGSCLGALLVACVQALRRATRLLEKEQP
jgi:VanZ family protein